MRPLSALLLVALLVGCDATAPSSDALAVRYLVEGQADVTYVSPGGTSTARADGAWQTSLSMPTDQTLSVEAVSTDGQPVTAAIEVNGQVVASRTGLRVRSDSRTGPRGFREVEVRGPIEALSAARVRVAGRAFVLDGSTELLGRRNEPVALSAFAVGTYVEAEGYMQADGTLRAKKLKLEDGDDDNDEHEVEVEGVIDAITATSVTVAGTVFATDGATRWLDDDNDPISRDAFRVGLRAEAEGWTRDGVLTAEKVKLDDD